MAMETVNAQMAIKMVEERKKIEETPGINHISVDKDKVYLSIEEEPGISKEYVFSRKEFKEVMLEIIYS